MQKEDIKKRLIEKFPNSFVEVEDMTMNNNHFSLLVISEKFHGLSLIDRHKMIYNIFSDELTNEIHALQIKTYTKNEWNKKPDCKLLLWQECGVGDEVLFSSIFNETEKFYFRRSFFKWIQFFYGDCISNS